MTTRDELAAVIYAHTPLMTIVHTSHRLADAIIRAGWLSAGEVEAQVRHARLVGTANAVRNFQDSMPVALKRAEAEAWQRSVEWFALRTGTERIRSYVLEEAEAANPYEKGIDR